MPAGRGMRFVAPLSSHDYCLRIVRNYDNENFVINTLLPRGALRKQHAALRAFNVELARIRTSVSNEDLGALRITFFRDALNTILSTSTISLQSPVLEALAEAYSATPCMDLQPFHRLIDARARDLSYPNFPSLNSLATFAADLQSPLIHAHATALLPEYNNSSAVSDAARYAGEAVGLAVLLRGAPAHAASRLCYAPADVAQDAGADPSKLLVGGPIAAEVFGVVGDQAMRALRLAEAALQELPRHVRPAFWGLLLPKIYLDRLAAVGGDPYDEKLQQSMRFTYPLRLQVALLGRRLFRR